MRRDKENKITPGVESMQIQSSKKSKQPNTTSEKQEKPDFIPPSQKPNK